MQITITSLPGMGNLSKNPLEVKPNAEQLAQPFLTFASDALKALGESLQRVVDELNAIHNPPKRPTGMIGGPGSVHPSAYQRVMEQLQNEINNFNGLDALETKVLDKLKKIAGDLVPRYNEFIGLKIYYPDATHPTIRFEDSEGNEITRAKFEEIKQAYLNTLSEVQARFQQGLVVETNQLQNLLVEAAQKALEFLKV